MKIDIKVDKLELCHKVIKRWFSSLTYSSDNVEFSLAHSLEYFKQPGHVEKSKFRINTFKYSDIVDFIRTLRNHRFKISNSAQTKVLRDTDNYQNCRFLTLESSNNCDNPSILHI